MVLHIGLNLRPRLEVLRFACNKLTLFPKHINKKHSRRRIWRSREAGDVADIFYEANSPSHVKLVATRGRRLFSTIFTSVSPRLHILFPTNVKDDAVSSSMPDLMLLKEGV